MDIEKYIHHGKEVSVISKIKGMHRDHCLCHQQCRHFKPERKDNCPIAQANYRLCVEHDIVTPVYECPKYEPIQ